MGTTAPAAAASSGFGLQPRTGLARWDYREPVLEHRQQSPLRAWQTQLQILKGIANSLYMRFKWDAKLQFQIPEGSIESQQIGIVV